MPFRKEFDSCKAFVYLTIVSIAFFLSHSWVAMYPHHSPEQSWLEELGRFQPVLAEMLAREPEEQQRMGYFTRSAKYVSNLRHGYTPRS